MLDECFPLLSHLGENMTIYFYMFRPFVKYYILAMYNANWLSQYSLIRAGCVTPRLNKIYFSHFNSQFVVSIYLYSASPHDLESVCCFLVFQDIGKLPKRTNHLVRDRCVKGQPANLNGNIHISINHMHYSIRYNRRTCSTASKCSSYWQCINWDSTQ